MKGNRIFIIGPPRTGTGILIDILSKHSKIKAYSQRSEHWPASDQVEKDLSDGYHVVQKFPGHVFDFPSIYNRFKDAYFIFTDRDLDEIIESYKSFPNDIRDISVCGETNPGAIYRKYIGMFNAVDMMGTYEFKRVKVHLSNIKKDGLNEVNAILKWIGEEMEENVKNFIDSVVGNVGRGLLNVVEDFYPLSEEEAFVTTGEDFTRLRRICVVKYKVIEGKVVIDGSSAKAICEGEYLRLGNFYNDDLIFSDRERRGILPEKYKCGSDGAHQPFVDSDGTYYTDGDGKNKGVYFNGKLLIKLWGNIKELGNPFVHGDYVYFEAREDVAPRGWQIWKYNKTNGDKELVKDNGANPCIFDGKIFYGKWNGNFFDIIVEDL